MTKFLGHIIYILIKLLSFTYRFKNINQENTPKDQYVLAIWHQNLLGGIIAQSSKKHLTMVSSSKDGELIAIPLKLLGHRPVRGSSTRGGKTAMVEMIKLLKETPGAITIDGPVGPIFSVKPGVFKIAKASGKPIIPYLVYPSSFWTFSKSWDQFRFPKPFSKLLIVYGKPIYINEELGALEIERLAQELKQSLFDAEAKAQDYLKA